MNFYVCSSFDFCCNVLSAHKNANETWSKIDGNASCSCLENDYENSFEHACSHETSNGIESDSVPERNFDCAVEVSMEIGRVRGSAIANANRYILLVNESRTTP